MSEVAFLDNYRAHLSVPTFDGNCHVIPVSLVNDVISGKKPPSILGDEVLKAVLAEWLGRIGTRNG